MAAKKLLKLIYIDAEGEPYNEAVISAQTARDVIGREPHEVRMDGETVTLGKLSYAVVSKCRRAVCVKLAGDRKGHEILITTADQQ